MKIAMVKQECSNGDKATITGTVKWIGDIDTHQGQEGEFTTQTLLLVDGAQTDDKRNSIFCQFSADGRSMKPGAKGDEITVQGTVNIYEGKTGLRNCKAQYPDKGQQSTSQNAQQDTSQPTGQAKGKEEVDWDAKDLRCARENGLNNATKIICLLAEMTKNDAYLNLNHVKKVASELVDYIYNGFSSSNPSPAESKQMAQEFKQDVINPEPDNQPPF